MKEIFSAFGSEIFRPLATILIPGAMAICAWFVGLLQRFPSVRTLVDANHTETTLLLVLASIGAGLMVEDIGSRIESRYFDKWLAKRTEFCAHSEEWCQYLRLAFKTEPVGQRYLRTILLRFKFELGSAIAFLSTGFGLFQTNLPLYKSLMWFGFLAAVAAYLVFVEARSSHRLLSEVRHEILKGAVIYPVGASE
jgi:hypothetical protein